MDSSLRTLDPTTPPRPPARSYGGWALQEALALDDFTPGLLGASCRWGAARRQVAFLVLARLRGGKDANVLARGLDGALLESGVAVDAACDPRAIVGRALLAVRPRKVLRAALGGVLPSGLAGTLRRLGRDPLPAPDDYADIVRLFSSGDPIDRSRVRILSQYSGGLTVGQIQALTALEPLLIHRTVLRHMRDRESAETFVDAVAYVGRCCSAATDAALRASLDRWPPDRRLKDWLRRWADRFDRPPGLDGLARALADRPDVKLLTTGADVIAAERRHRRGPRLMVPEVIAGRHALIEYRPTAPGVPVLLCQLRWTERGWLLEKTHRLSIRYDETEGVAELREHLRAAGVILKSRVPLELKMYHALAVWLDVYRWSSDDSE